MGATPALTVGIIAGEESGDLLGADLIRALAAASGREVRLLGVGGAHLAALGLRSLFDPQQIAIVGVGAVLRDLPRIAWRLKSTSQALAAAQPDCVITIDVPDFSLRVAERLRRSAPNLPIVHYVCPSVWAWRSGRALAMKSFVDHVLCILPFEPAELRRLGGPPGTYVGHRLAHDPALREAARRREAGRPVETDDKVLLLLPGSRGGEVSRLLGDFRKTVSVLRGRGHGMRLLLPAVPHLAAAVAAETAGWDPRPEILEGADAKWEAFATADAALIASGTVSLELALAGVPHVSTYRLDPMGRLVKRLITSWSACLPNLVTDKPVVPEFYDEGVRPAALARFIEALWEDTEQRRWQAAGFRAVRDAMRTAQPAGETAAGIVLDMLAGRRGE